MKNTVKVFSITMILLALASTAFAKEKDRLDKWLDKYELYSVDWLPADIALIEKLQNSLLM